MAVEGCGVLVEEVGKGTNAVIVDFVVSMADADEVSEFDYFGAKLDRGECGRVGPAYVEGLGLSVGEAEEGAGR